MLLMTALRWYSTLPQFQYTARTSATYPEKAAIFWGQKQPEAHAHRAPLILPRVICPVCCKRDPVPYLPAASRTECGSAHIKFGHILVAIYAHDPCNYGHTGTHPTLAQPTRPGCHQPARPKTCQTVGHLPVRWEVTLQVMGESAKHVG